MLAGGDLGRERERHGARGRVVGVAVVLAMAECVFHTDNHNKGNR